MDDGLQAVGTTGAPTAPGAGVLAPAVAAALVALAALAGAGAVVLAVLGHGPWLAVVLPVLAVAASAVPARRAVRVAGCAVLLAGALVAAVVAGGSAGAAVVAAVVLAAAVATWWERQRRDAAAHVSAAHELLDAVSVIDEVTGCYNANGLDLLARHVLGSVRRASGAMHASLVEVADLAAVADAGGRDAVTEVVCAVADALRGSTRGADVVGRWSPDVFVVLGPGTGVTPAELERRLRARLLATPGRPTSRWVGALTVGSGLLEPWDGGGLAELVARAEQDLALRRALRAPSASEPARRDRRRHDRSPGRSSSPAAPPTAPPTAPPAARQPPAPGQPPERPEVTP